MPRLLFTAEDRIIVADVDNLVIAGWTGRDAVALEEHIAELEAIGVARPSTVPCFYRVGKNLLTTEEQLDVCGEQSSGEAEYVLLSLSDGLFVGIGSDHTDRKVEIYCTTVSKQMCPKPIGPALWPFHAVKEHWDRLILRSWVTIDGVRTLYQEGTVARMLAPEDLTRRYLDGSEVLPIGTVMYCGTLPVQNTIGGGEKFEIELEDPIRNRTLKHSYSPRNLTYAD